MKASLHRLILSLIVALLFLASALIVSLSSYGSVPRATFSDSIVVQKKLTNKNHKVSLYPDAKHRALFFSVKGKSGHVYQIYLFDMDGKLVTQREIRNKQTTYISEFERGVYLFDVFCDDERIGNGQIDIM
jgi:hypothetical protein